MDNNYESGLHGKLMAIERIPDWMGVDKTRLYREVLEESRRKYLVLEKVINGETSFENEVTDIYRKFGGAKSFYPGTADDETKEKMKELSDTLGSPSVLDPYISEFFNIALNPVGGAAVGTVAGLAFSGATEKVSRRQVLKYCALGALAGSVMGSLLSMTKEKNFADLVWKAERIDEKIREVYGADI